MKKRIRRGITLLISLLMMLQLVLPALAEGETDGNDGYDTAASLPLDTGVKGTIDSKTDEDWFKLKLTADRLIVIRLEHGELGNPDKPYYNIQIYDSDRELLEGTFINAISTGRDTLWESPVYGLKAGTYYIRIAPHANLYDASGYTLTAATVQADAFELIPNDSSQNATALPLNTPCLGSSSLMDDEDWFRVTLSEADTVTLLLEHPETKTYLDENYYRITLYDETAKTTLHESWGVTGRETEWTAEQKLEAGTYYIRLRPYAFLCDETYTLQVLTSEAAAARKKSGSGSASGEEGSVISGGSGELLETRVDETEDNDSFETANLIPLNASVLGTAVHQNNTADTDCFLFEVKKAGSFTFDFHCVYQSEAFQAQNPNPSFSFTLIDYDEPDNRKFYVNLSNDRSDVRHSAVNSFENGGELNYSTTLQPGFYYVVIQAEVRGEQSGNAVYGDVSYFFSVTGEDEANVIFTINNWCYYINDDWHNCPVEPYLKRDRTYIPVRAAAEAMNAEVSWDSKTRKVTIWKPGTTIELMIGSRIITVNGVKAVMDVAPEIRAGSTCLPIRHVAEALGATVEWNERSKQVTIQY